eukprot:SAG31_NODE_424_length_15826_cov_4.954664_18_plen_53_part_00
MNRVLKVLCAVFCFRGRAKRDVPKVEVCFNIDANGILTVTAEDKVRLALAST